MLFACIFSTGGKMYTEFKGEWETKTEKSPSGSKLEIRKSFKKNSQI